MVGISRLTEIALGEANISVTQYRILHHLHRGRSIQSDLAFRLAVSKQSVTRIVDTLVEKGYIKRRVDREDRRRVIHAITAKGERALARVDEILERFLLMILQDLEDDADVETTRAALRLFAQSIRGELPARRAREHRARSPHPRLEARPPRLHRAVVARLTTGSSRTVPP